MTAEKETNPFENFSYNDDTRTLSLKSFKVLKLVAKGGFGRVFKVLKYDDNKFYAIKELQKPETLKRSRGVELAMTEINVMKYLEHPFIIKLAYAFQGKYNLYAVLEYAKGGTLRRILKKEKILMEKHAAFYSKEIISGIEYLHSKHVIHRDIKPANILIDKYGHVKLADFGICKENFTAGKRAFSKCGTSKYLAPEVYMGQGYGTKVDWWAFGIIFYEMVCGEDPSNLTREQQKNLNVFGIFPDFNISNKAKSLICGLLNSYVDERFGSFEIKNHEFFQGTSWDDVVNCMEPPPNLPRKRSNKNC